MSRLLSVFVGLLLSLSASAQEGEAQETAPFYEQFLTSMDTAFGTYFVGPIATVMFFDLAFFTDAFKLPLVVVWLVFGATFFTLRMQFIKSEDEL